METSKTVKDSSLRWGILRQALIRRPSHDDNQSHMAMRRISRRTAQGFNLIPCVVDETKSEMGNDVRLCYTLPTHGAPKLYLRQRVVNGADLSDFEICNRYDIDNTGLVCNWPSEEVLAYFCLSHADLFRSKRVIEIGSGYGLAGLVIAASTEASEVVISDGNPQVVDYVQRNIDGNSGEFGGTIVKSLTLHWNQEDISHLSGTFDVIVASDCTFFKEFHRELARTVSLLLNKNGPSEAIFFSPRRGDTLEKFLEEIKQIGLNCSTTENYDVEILNQSEKFMNGGDSWPGYEKDHCYPLLIRITL